MEKKISGSHIFFSPNIIYSDVFTKHADIILYKYVTWEKSCKMHLKIGIQRGRENYLTWKIYAP